MFLWRPGASIVLSIVITFNSAISHSSLFLKFLYNRTANLRLPAECPGRLKYSPESFPPPFLSLFPRHHYMFWVGTIMARNQEVSSWMKSFQNAPAAVLRWIVLQSAQIIPSTNQMLQAKFQTDRKSYFYLMINRIFWPDNSIRVEGTR